MPCVVLSAENTAANNLSPQEAPDGWGMQTEKSTTTQQGEVCHRGLGRYRDTQLSAGGGQRGFQKRILAEAPGNISK